MKNKNLLFTISLIILTRSSQKKLSIPSIVQDNVPVILQINKSSNDDNDNISDNIKIPDGYYKQDFIILINTDQNQNYNHVIYKNVKYENGKIKICKNINCSLEIGTYLSDDQSKCKINFKPSDCVFKYGFYLNNQLQNGIPTAYKSLIDNVLYSKN